MVTPSSDLVIQTINSIFKNQIKPNLKKSLWSKAMNEDWESGELSRYTTSDIVTVQNADSDDENIGK